MENIEWVKKALRDYYKPKLRRELKHEPSREELDQRFREIYGRLNFTLLVGVNKGVSVVFHEIAKISLDEFDRFRDNVEGYILQRFGGGNFKLNFYEGPSFVVTVNYKPEGEPKWKHLIADKT
ncbi:MAG: hypothetical protein ACE5G9_04340 [Nitrospinales bacterium]